MHFNDQITKITFYSDYCKAEVDAVITFQRSNNKNTFYSAYSKAEGDAVITFQ